MCTVVDIGLDTGNLIREVVYNKNHSDAAKLWTSELSVGLYRVSSFGDVLYLLVSLEGDQSEVWADGVSYPNGGFSIKEQFTT